MREARRPPWSALGRPHLSWTYFGSRAPTPTMTRWVGRQSGQDPRRRIAKPRPKPGEDPREREIGLLMALFDRAATVAATGASQHEADC